MMTSGFEPWARSVCSEHGVRGRTGSSNDDRVTKAQDQGDELRRLGAQVVLKPFDIDQLLGAINAFWLPTSPVHPDGTRVVTADGEANWTF